MFHADSNQTRTACLKAPLATWACPEYGVNVFYSPGPDAQQGHVFCAEHRFELLGPQRAGILENLNSRVLNELRTLKSSAGRLTTVAEEPQIG